MATQRQEEKRIHARETTPGTTVRRRGLVAGAVALVAGVIAKQTAQPVAAGTDGDVVLGAPNSTANDTTITNTVASSGHALVLHCDAASYGFGLLATGSGYGVQGTGGTYAGVFGDIANSTGSGVTGLSRSSSGGVGVSGSSDAANGIGVNGSSANGLGGAFQGGLAPLRLVPAPVGTGAPTTGTHQAGELYVDSAGSFFYCMKNGTPGTWITLSAPTFKALSTPERFVDTRINLGGVQGPLPDNTTHTFQMTGRAGESGNPALIIPDAATTLVGNLTVVGEAGIPVGSFVTLWPGGPQPTVSNINVGPGGVVANSYVVALSSSGGHGRVSVYNQHTCDYVLDVTGYYA